MRVTLTGGAGYIGSHTAVALLEAGHDVQILDNFANAARDVPERIATIAKRSPELIELCVTDRAALNQAFDAFRPDAVIHFAGLKAVGEAVENPLEYFRVNVTGSLALFQTMAKHRCNKIVFSSSATVYGDPERFPIPEDHPIRPANPYGRTKQMVEDMMRDWTVAAPGLAAVSLRYFNPVGAHPSAQIGEDPRGIPNNLMPFIAQVATGRREKLQVFGDDYDTPDGTGVRDYVHVVDLAEAHLAALNLTSKGTGLNVLNVGAGQGYTVLQMIEAFEKASERTIPYQIVDRRPGDVARLLADPTQAQLIMGWKAARGLDQMCIDAWRWAQENT